MKNIVKNIFIIGLILNSSLSFSQEVTGDSDDREFVVPSTEAASLAYLIPSEGFIPGTGFTGYFHAMTQTSIVLTNVKDANYIDIKRSMTDDFFKENKLVKLGEFNVECNNGMTGYGYIAKFELEGRQMIRHMVFVGTLNQTLWINTTCPEEYYELVSKELFGMYKTADLSRK